MRLHHCKFLRLSHALNAAIGHFDLHDFVLVGDVCDHASPLFFSLDESWRYLETTARSVRVETTLPRRNRLRAVLIEGRGISPFVQTDVESHRVTRVRVKTAEHSLRLLWYWRLALCHLRLRLILWRGPLKWSALRRL